MVQKLESGAKVSELSEEYGIKRTTIYSWLGRTTDGKRSEALELGKLRRENAALQQLVGQLVYEQEFRKKNRLS